VRSAYGAGHVIRRFGAAEVAAHLLSQFVTGYLGGDEDIHADTGLLEGQSTRLADEDGRQMRLKVLAVQDPIDYHGSWPPNEGDRYVGLWIEVTNLTSEEVGASELRLAVGDSTGTEYNPYTSLMEPQLPLSILPRSRVSAVLVFEVPIGIRLHSFRAAFGFAGAPVEWDLAARAPVGAPSG
jgi:hypothetical protein